MQTPPRRESNAYILSEDERRSVEHFSFPNSPVSQTSPQGSLSIDNIDSNQKNGSLFKIPKNNNFNSQPLILNDSKLKRFHKRQQQPISFNPLTKNFNTNADFLSSTEITRTPSGTESLNEIIRNPSFLTNDIIINTQDQIRRNSTGNYTSLLEFAKYNQIDTQNKIFVSCPESGDNDNDAKIDLDLSHYKIKYKYRDE